MKKLILLFSCLLLLWNTGYCQSMYGDAAKADVKMKYVYSFEEALEKSKREKKLIFFNCFADWAIPCHGMNKLVFSDQEFADWMDKHFINFFIDVTTPEGRPLAEKYNAKTMAQYLILDAEGNIVHRIVGGCRLPEFQERVACALSPKTSQAGMTKSYDAGERGVKFLGRYAKVLAYSLEEERYKKVVDEYFAALKPSKWSEKENWPLFSSKAREPESEKFRYLLEHKAEFAASVGDSLVCSWIAGVYSMPVFRMAIGDAAYEGGKLLDIYMKLKKAEIPADNPIFIIYEIAKFRGEKNFDRMMEVFGQKVPGMDDRTAVALDLSLKDWKELSVEEKKKVAEYLDKRSEGMSGNLLKTYRETIKEMINPEGIPFEDFGLDEALQKAAHTGKLVFVDCYTSWCGPCKMMSSQVFSQKAVGDYFKEHFVSLKVDMEKGEGPGLAEKYAVRAYPTMLVLTPEGNVKYKLLGGMDAPAFMEKIKRSRQPGLSYAELKDKHEAGDRSLALMSEYLITMSDAGELKDAYKETREYLNDLKDGERFSVSAWKLYDRFVEDYHSPEFKYLVGNRKKFIPQVGEQAVDKKIEQILFPAILSYLKGKAGEEDLGEVRRLIALGDFPAGYSLVLLDQIVLEYEQQDYRGIMDFYEDTVGKLPNGHTKLNLDVLLFRVLENAPAEVRKQALAYAKKAAGTVGAGAKNSYDGLIEMLSK